MGDGKSWLYLIGLFAIVFAVMLIVGFIGNKATDKMENAARARRARAQGQQSAKPPESLAQRYAKR